MRNVQCRGAVEKIVFHLLQVGQLLASIVHDFEDDADVSGPLHLVQVEVKLVRYLAVKVTQPFFAIGSFPSCSLQVFADQVPGVQQALRRYDRRTSGRSEFPAKH